MHTLLVGAEGVSEIQGQPWYHEATEEEKQAFIQQVGERTYRNSLVDNNGRPYWLITVHDDAPEAIRQKAARCKRCLRLTE